MRSIKKLIVGIVFVIAFVYAFNIQYVGQLLNIIGNAAIECVAGGDEYSTQLKTEMDTLSVSKFINFSFVDKTSEEEYYGIKYTVVDTYTAEEVNQWFKEKKGGDYRDPYKPGTMVKEIELLESTVFVRVYDKMPGGSQMIGAWVMTADSIKGLTAAQIRDKFALPNEPKYLCDVELNAGVHLRMGEVNPLEGWGCGGGIQYDMMEQRAGDFRNEREIP